MKPSAPSKGIWIVALILGVLGILGHFANIPVVTEHHFWLILAGFLLLALGTSFTGI